MSGSKKRDSTYTDLLPGEKHPPMFNRGGGLTHGNFVGPGTQALKRIKRGDTAITLVDRIAEEHDIRYSLGSDAKDINLADRIMMKELENLNQVHGDWYANILTGKAGIGSKQFLDNAIGKMKGKAHSIYLPKSELTDKDKQLLDTRLDTILAENEEYNPYTRTDRAHGGLYNNFYKNTASNTGAYPSKKEAAANTAKDIFDFAWDNKEEIMEIASAVYAGKFVKKYIRHPIEEGKQTIAKIKQIYSAKKTQISDFIRRVRSIKRSGGSINDLVDLEAPSGMEEMSLSDTQEFYNQWKSDAKYNKLDNINEMEMKELNEIPGMTADDMLNLIGDTDVPAQPINDPVNIEPTNIEPINPTNDGIPLLDGELTSSSSMMEGLATAEMGGMALGVLIGGVGAIVGAVKHHEYENKITAASIAMNKNIQGYIKEIDAYHSERTDTLDTDFKWNTSGDWKNDDSSAISMYMTFGAAAPSIIKNFNSYANFLKGIKDESLQAKMTEFVGSHNRELIRTLSTGDRMHDSFKYTPGMTKLQAYNQHTRITEFAPQEYHDMIETYEPFSTYKWPTADLSGFYSSDIEQQQKTSRYFLGRYGQSRIFSEPGYAKRYQSNITSYFDNLKKDTLKYYAGLTGTSIKPKNSDNTSITSIDTDSNTNPNMSSDPWLEHIIGNIKKVNNTTPKRSDDPWIDHIIGSIKNGDDHAETGIANDNHNSTQKKPGTGLTPTVHLKTSNGSSSETKRNNDNQMRDSNGLNTGTRQPGNVIGKVTYNPQDAKLMPVGSKYHHMNYIPTANAYQQEGENQPDSTVEQPAPEKVRDDLFLYAHDITPTNQETLMAQAKASFLKSRHHNDALS